MKLVGKQYITYKSRSSIITILGIGDIHYGNKGCDLRLLDQDIKRVETEPNTFFVLLGDYADYISHKDKRFEPECMDQDIRLADLKNLGQYYSEWTINKFKHIAHKCIGAIEGNHEEKYQRYNEQGHLHQYTCDELGVPNLGFMSLLDIVFVRNSKTKKPTLIREAKDVEFGSAWTVRHLITHGSGGAIAPQSKLKKAMDLVDRYDAQMYMMGHVHQKQPAATIKIGADDSCKNIVEHHYVVSICGGYLKTYIKDAQTYGELKMYRGARRGASVNLYDPTKKTISVIL